MVKTNISLKLRRLVRSSWTVIFNDHFCWTFIKSYGLFLLAIPLAKIFDGFQLMPTKRICA
ncbi:uncharacterized protein LOC128264299 [Drosophila gunungcola]|uniref:Uncharacterized protein n=1 Tax=Drosophila gunungcola TaxID=103775 RepID=A0A9P9YDN7_9MUSC|nr:uncharacterized protein LOC128264299 [Drosophila gunungcola]KAI8034643.1 hypothetical protein M5D96_012605 [Drosophila gunungcola]